MGATAIEDIVSKEVIQKDIDVLLEKQEEAFLVRLYYSAYWRGYSQGVQDAEHGTQTVLRWDP